MNEQEVWVRMYCAEVGKGKGIDFAVWHADEGLREFRTRARSVGPCEIQVIEIPGDE